MASTILLLGLLSLFFYVALASDNSPLQDFCVADPTSQGLLSLSFYAALASDNSPLQDFCVADPTSQEAVDCIRDLSDAQQASEEELSKEALSGKSLDDISCVVALFQ
ncbi:hypothetical protein LOK49_LG09G02455 [Camellia lanceoleosa]|uniref:Uncharacterized protein n=1 Tax=Camellia lanceoleosa TaxID=1840588 RepID=A0ACC0GJJ3_9ERIC|nr:hypothetical protein LOK49_LG09G02455 [Camellia lanceoleosa]